MERSACTERRLMSRFTSDRSTKMLSDCASIAPPCVTPTSSPLSLTSGPPLSPGLVGESVSITLAWNVWTVSLVELRLPLLGVDLPDLAGRVHPQRAALAGVADRVDRLARFGARRGQRQCGHALRHAIDADERQIRPACRSRPPRRGCRAVRRGRGSTWRSGMAFLSASYRGKKTVAFFPTSPTTW